MNTSASSRTTTATAPPPARSTLRGLALLGAAPGTLSYVVPDRAVHGYGLTPTIVEPGAEARKPKLLVTVDNGIASHAGVALRRALRAGRVLVTDHHLPAVTADGQPTVPDADALIEPQPAGLPLPEQEPRRRRRGVLRADWRCGASCARRGAFAPENAAAALDAPARPGRAGHGRRRGAARRQQPPPGGAGPEAHARRHACSRACRRCPPRRAATRHAPAASTSASRSARASTRRAGSTDMTLGITCLTTDDSDQALGLARELDSINPRAPRDGSRHAASRPNALLERLMDGSARTARRRALALFDARLPRRRRRHRGLADQGPAAPPGVRLRRGRGRPAQGLGPLDPRLPSARCAGPRVKRHPDLLRKFGGHAMAAGCTLAPGGVEAFAAAFEDVAREWLDEASLTRTLRTDGPPPPEAFCAETVQEPEAQVWGQAFEAPLFCDRAGACNQRHRRGAPPQAAPAPGAGSATCHLVRPHEQAPPSR